MIITIKKQMKFNFDDLLHTADYMNYIIPYLGAREKAMMCGSSKKLMRIIAGITELWRYAAISSQLAITYIRMLTTTRINNNTGVEYTNFISRTIYKLTFTLPPRNFTVTTGGSNIDVQHCSELHICSNNGLIYIKTLAHSREVVGKIIAQTFVRECRGKIGIVSVVPNQCIVECSGIGYGTFSTSDKS